MARRLAASPGRCTGRTDGSTFHASGSQHRSCGALLEGTELALRLSYDLDGVTDREVFLDAVTSSLEAMFPSEALGWVGLDPSSGDLEIRGTGHAGRPDVVDAVSRNMYRHLQLLSYTSTSATIGLAAELEPDGIAADTLWPRDAGRSAVPRLLLGLT